MSIQLNSNLKIAAPAPADKRYLSERTLNGTPLPYSSHTEVFNIIPSSERYVGLTVVINDSGTTGVNKEYWFKNDINTLIEKIYDTTIPTSNFVTGGTNIGFFSGYTGIQTLPITNLLDATNYSGNYNSLYNNYYRDSNGIIRIGTPTDGIPKRGYVKTTLPVKSWVWSETTIDAKNGWNFVDGNLETILGNAAPVYGNALYYNGITTFPYTATTWISGSPYNNGSAIVSIVTGSLLTGNTITIGGPIYSDTESNIMQLRTIKSKTPSYINITYDDAFVYLSGTSAVITAQNVGSGYGIFSQKTGSTLQFRTLISSGDTTISQRGNCLIIYSSSNDSRVAVTGGTNLGTGIGVYSSVLNRNMCFNSLVGSGNTSISQVGNNIIINSSCSASEKFTSNITVSIASGKTFGKYLNGDIIPASGKTANDVIKLALAEALVPTINLSDLGTGDVSFGQSGKTVNLSFSYTINTVGAHVASTSLQYNRGSGWNVLTTSTGATTYTHNIDDSANRFNATAIQYKYSVIDSAGGSGSTIITVTPQAYVAPTISSLLNGTITSPETQTVREKGNVISSPSGSITSNRILVKITAWTLERRYNGGSYVVLASGSSLNTLTATISPTLDNGIPTSATSIDYRITYTDQYTTGNGGSLSISFKYFSYYGFNINTTLTSTQIKALANKNFLSSQSLTWNAITAGSNYTYYAYPSTYGDITSILKNGIAQDFGAWSQLAQVSVINSYGESLNYKVWKTNATNAYTGDNLVFS